MEYRFFHGPDRVPFALVGDGSVEGISALPFHGIVSRGLLEILMREDPEGTLWHRYSHLLETPQRDGPGEDSDARLTRLREFAREAAALSFGQSARCAQSYVDLSFASGGAVSDATCDLWNIKEGHTSSVWICSSDAPGADPLEPFVLNVARDRVAGRELEETSLRMQRIATQCPGINMAKVREIRYLPLDCGPGAINVVVTRNDFVAHSLEIYKPLGRTGDSDQWFLVERFLTNPANPSRITSIVGRNCSMAEIGEIRSGIEHFVTSVPPDIAFELRLHEGDVVWDGEQAVIVALS